MKNTEVLSLQGGNQHCIEYTRSTQFVCRILKDDRGRGGCCSFGCGRDRASFGCGRDRASFAPTIDKKIRETNPDPQKNQTKIH
jgi:hypothetical protein